MVKEAFIENLAEKIRNLAFSLGFDDCGLVKVGKIGGVYREHFNNWLKSGYNAKMHWIENNIEIRFNPALLLENAKTAIIVLQGHDFEQKKSENKIARVFLGEDYHKSMRKKLKILSRGIKEFLPETNTRICVDSAPILEKYWAQEAGLGFIGKNTLFISSKIGSFCNIGILLSDIDLELENSSKVKDFCENCDKCIKSCPTNALSSPYTLDCNKCIAYQTIYKSSPDFNNFAWSLGCDICQEVCPQNR